jgi:DNA-binding PadR family transcriptional regulator
MGKKNGGVIVLSALEENILTLLVESPQGIYGLDILNRLNAAAKKIGRREFGVGSLYPALKRMEHQRLITGRWGEEVPGEESGGARRRYYSISLEGKKSLDDTHEFRQALASQRGQLAPEGV